MASTFSQTEKAMAIIPKASGLVSFCSSAFIVQYVLRDPKRRRLVYHRLLLGMSTSDLFGSLNNFLSTWPSPRGEAYLALGTVRTCEAQGFFDQTAALCTPTYHVSLAIYYVLVIVRGWNESRVSRIEKYLHALPVLAGFSTGMAALALRLYNNAGFTCWIAPGLPNHPDRHNPNYGAFRLAFLYCPAWFIVCFLAAAMIVIYVDVLRSEKRLDKYAAAGLNEGRRDQSRKVRNQAFLYVGCVYLTWLFGSIARFMQFAGREPPDAIGILFVVVYPLQGFFNLVVYVFPRYYRKTIVALRPVTSSTARRMNAIASRMTPHGHAGSEKQGGEEGLVTDTPQVGNHGHLNIIYNIEGGAEGDVKINGPTGDALEMQTDDFNEGTVDIKRITVIHQLSTIVEA